MRASAAASGSAARRRRLTLPTRRAAAHRRASSAAAARPPRARPHRSVRAAPRQPARASSRVDRRSTRRACFERARAQPRARCASAADARAGLDDVACAPSAARAPRPRHPARASRVSRGSAAALQLALRALRSRRSAIGRGCRPAPSRAGGRPSPARSCAAMSRSALVEQHRTRIAGSTASALRGLAPRRSRAAWYPSNGAGRTGVRSSACRSSFFASRNSREPALREQDHLQELLLVEPEDLVRARVPTSTGRAARPTHPPSIHSSSWARCGSVVMPCRAALRPLVFGRPRHPPPPIRRR